MNEADARRHAELVVRGARTSFYWAMRLLPRPRREAMYAIYALCRELDDIADRPAASEDRLARLDDWRRELDALYAGTPGRPTSLALLAPIRRFELERDEFEELVRGMEMDVRGEMVAPGTDRLGLYCRRVAGAVGVLAVRVFGCPGPEARAFALTLGEALQLTNILRDLDEDAALGRLYLPREVLQAAGVAALRDPRAALADPGLPRACEALADRAESRFAEAEAALRRTDARRLRPAATMMAVYHRLLLAMRRRGWETREPAPRLAVPTMFWLALRHSLLARP